MATNWYLDKNQITGLSPPKSKSTTYRQKRLTKLQVAQKEYDQRVSYTFMKRGSMNNYWKQNQKIIASYAQYYQSSDAEKYKTSTQHCPPSTGIGTARMNNSKMQDFSQTYSQFSKYNKPTLNTDVSKLNKDFPYNNKAMSVPNRKGIDYNKNQSQIMMQSFNSKKDSFPANQRLSDSGFHSTKINNHNIASPPLEQYKPIPTTKMFNNSRGFKRQITQDVTDKMLNTRIKQAFMFKTNQNMFPEINNGKHSSHSHVKGTSRQMKERISELQNRIEPQLVMGEPNFQNRTQNPNCSMVDNMIHGGDSIQDIQASVCIANTEHNLNESTHVYPVGVEINHIDHSMMQKYNDNNSSVVNIERQTNDIIESKVPSSPGNLLQTSRDEQHITLNQLGGGLDTNHGSLCYVSNIPKIRNKQLLTVSDSLMSHMLTQKTYSKNHASKKVRNYNGLYEQRFESDRLREMKEKYRIGDGSAVEPAVICDISKSNSIMYNTSNHFAQGQLQELRQNQSFYFQSNRKKFESPIKIEEKNPDPDWVQPQIEKKVFGDQNKIVQEAGTGTPDPDYNGRNLSVNISINDSKSLPVQKDDTQNSNVTTNEYVQKVLAGVKPVLRKQTIHNSKNIFLVFRSIEIQVVEEKWNEVLKEQEFKYFTPLYIPVMKLQEYMQYDKSNLEIRLLKSVYQQIEGHQLVDQKQLSPSGSPTFRSGRVDFGSEFVFLDAEDLAAEENANLAAIYPEKSVSERVIHFKKSGPHTETAPQQHISKIKTNVLMDNGKLYRVLITMPRIEYSIESSDFSIVKVLNASELAEYTSDLYIDWHMITLQQFTSYKRFEQQLLDIQELVAGGTNLKSKKLGKTGEQLKLLGIEGRNHGISLKVNVKKRNFAKHSHSFIPGQCKHAHVEEERLSPKKGELDDERLMITELSSEGTDYSVLLNKVAAPKMLQPCIFEMKEKSTKEGPQVKVIKYNSKQEYEEYFLLHQNISDIRGVFDRDNTLGQIHLSAFTVSIKSMDSDNFSYQKALKLNEWQEYCGYMKKQASENISTPQQLVDHITAIFQKQALKNQQDKFDLAKICYKSYKDDFFQVQLNVIQSILQKSQTGEEAVLDQLKKKTRAICNEYLRLQNRQKIITVNPTFNKKEYLGKNTEPLPIERYCIEIQPPTIKITYKEGIHEKKLDEHDVDYLLRSNFQGWIQYFLNSHFRKELGITYAQPTPRVSQFMTEGEKILNEKLAQFDYDLKEVYNERIPLKPPSPVEEDGKENAAEDQYPDEEEIDEEDTRALLESIKDIDKEGQDKVVAETRAEVKERVRERIERDLKQQEDIVERLKALDRPILVGQAYLKLLSLGLQTESSMDAPIVKMNTSGDQMLQTGSLQVSCKPCSASGSTDEADLPDEFMVLDAQELLGLSNLYFKVYIKGARGLPTSLSTNCYVSYSFKWQNQDIYKTEECISRTSAPLLNYEKVHQIENITQQVVDELQNGSIEFQVFALPGSSNLPGNATSAQ